MPPKKTGRTVRGRPKKLYSDRGLSKEVIETRDLAMSDLRLFVGLVAPHLHIGTAHKELMKFLMEPHERQLVIWPRGHLKSTLAAYDCAWEIVKNPAITTVLLSATSDLAEKQVGLIKGILESKPVQRYWPELLEQETGKRELWRTHEFSVTHWKRKEEVVRDPTLKAAGLTGNITGFHADLIMLDDVVTGDNSETKTEREKVNTAYSYLSSILNPGGKVKAIGTRYHPDDLYSTLTSMRVPIYDDEGNETHSVNAYNVTQEVVEVDGQFLWPRSQREDGKWFGFNKQELAKKKADYVNIANFWAQYYNNPSDPTNKRVEDFLYYDRSKLKQTWNGWTYDDRKLNIYAAIDFAATMSKRSDYTAIVVAGIDAQHNIFVLDIDRFKTDRASVMADHLEKLYAKWKWLKLRAEAAGQQKVIITSIRDENRRKGVFYRIEEVTPTKEKQLRIMSTLEPRYAQGVIFHFVGGLCETLEEEMQSTKPPHDDVSDAFASCVEIMIPPKRLGENKQKVSNISYHPRFGGVC